MRKSFIIIAVFLALFSCKQHLLVRDIQTENISNSPSVFLPDPVIVSLVEPYKNELESDMSQVVSISIDEMIKKKPESKLTNYLADLLLEEGVAFCKLQGYSFEPQIAYMNYGGIRSSLPKGEITVGNIFELMPFENEMVIVELTGKDLIALAEHIAARGGDAVAGISLGIKNGEVINFEVNGNKPIVNKNYFLVTNDYVATGGDGMAMFANRKKYVETGMKIRDVIIHNMEKDYREGIKISASKDGRVYYE